MNAELDNKSPHAQEAKRGVTHRLPVNRLANGGQLHVFQDGDQAVVFVNDAAIGSRLSIKGRYIPKEVHRCKGLGVGRQAGGDRVLVDCSNQLCAACKAGSHEIVCIQ